MENKFLRSVPKTSRGERRVSLILDAAAEIIAEVGYEATTTNAIALHAGTSIGSLYQFFPNKETLVQALAERYQTDLQGLLNAALEKAAGQLTFAEQIALLVDGLVDFSAQNAAFETLFCLSSGNLQTVIPFEALRIEMLGRVLTIFELWAPRVRAEKRGLYAEVSMCAVQALLPLTHTGPVVKPEWVAEVKRLVAGYLSSVFGGAVE